MMITIIPSTPPALVPCSARECKRRCRARRDDDSALARHRLRRAPGAGGATTGDGEVGIGAAPRADDGRGPKIARPPVPGHAPSERCPFVATLAPT
eukprot:scaffold3213_cov202-Prasinococcus_capsulatus_cf.AAC.1